jgi:hypothetical protein
MNRLRKRQCLWFLGGLCVTVVFLAAGACKGEPEVAAGSSLPRASSSRKPGSQPRTQTRKPAGSRARASVDGTWLVRFGNRSLTLKLITEGQGIRGFVRENDGAVTPVNIGVFSGDAFLFEASVDKSGWLWSGELSPDGLTGHRENLQSGVVEQFTAQRPE